jgi:hypothetical protein
MTQESRGNPPALVIRIELEALPKAYADVRYEGEAARLKDWIASTPELQKLVTVASAAYAGMVERDKRKEK